MIQTDLLGTASIVLQMGSENEIYNVGDKLIGKTDAGMMGAIGESLLPSVENILPKVDTLLLSVTRITSDSSLIWPQSNVLMQYQDPLTAQCATLMPLLQNCRQQWTT